jgi:hypothetical protein
MRELATNDRSHVERLILVEDTSRLHPWFGSCGFAGVDWDVDLGLDFGG